jgi:hypothetical protein
MQQRLLQIGGVTGWLEIDVFLKNMGGIDSDIIWG